MIKRIYKAVQRLKINGKSVPKGALLDSSMLELLSAGEIDKLCNRNPPALELVTEVKPTERHSENGVIDKSDSEKPSSDNAQSENPNVNTQNEAPGDSFTDFESSDFEPLNIEEFERANDEIADSETEEARSVENGKKANGKSTKK